MYDSPCPPPPFDYPEYWPAHHSHKALCEWWEMYIMFLFGWSWWASTDAGDFLQ
jgi:hypothetical protein